MSSTQENKLLIQAVRRELFKRKVLYFLPRLIHRIRCRWYQWILPRDLNIYLKRWMEIDKRKDRSHSARDFRFWLYLRLLRNYETYDTKTKEM